MRVQFPAVTFLTALALTACGSAGSELVGTWKPMEGEGYVVIREEADALHIEIPGENCKGIISGEESPFELALECVPEGSINTSEHVGTLKVVNDDTIILHAEEDAVGMIISALEDEDSKFQRVED